MYEEVELKAKKNPEKFNLILTTRADKLVD